MIKDLFKKFNFLIMPMLITMLGLSFLSMVFNLIGAGSAGYGFYVMFSNLVMMAIVGFGLYARIKGKKEWFKLFVIVLFAYTFVATAKAVFASMNFYSGMNGLVATLNVFEFLANLALATAGVTLVLTLIFTNEKFLKIAEEIINWAMVAFFGLTAIIFILTVIGAFVDSAYSISWKQIPSVLYSFAFGVLFAILYNAKDGASVEETDKGEETTEAEEVFEAPQTEEVEETPVAEEAEPETEEAVAEEPIAEDAVAETPIAEEEVEEAPKKKKASAKKKSPAKKKSKAEESGFEGGVVDVIGPVVPAKKRK